VPVATLVCVAVLAVAVPLTLRRFRVRTMD
jgi:hypothetical protein